MLCVWERGFPYWPHHSLFNELKYADRTNVPTYTTKAYKNPNKRNTTNKKLKHTKNP